MPGPGGGGGGGFGGGGPGGFGGPGGPGGFGGPGGPGGFGGPGGPGFGGPGWGGPGWGGLGWGGPWFGPGFGGPFFLAGPEFGPCGLPWCWWPILVLILPYLIIVSIGIVLIQTLEGCDDDSANADTMDESMCVGYELLYAIVLAVVMTCCFCCCFVGCRDREEGSPAERAPMMATEAPPPAMVYAQEAPAPLTKPVVAVEAGTRKYA